jgi:hypothetical protein
MRNFAALLFVVNEDVIYVLPLRVLAFECRCPRFPVFRDTDVTVITTWPSFLLVDLMVLESIRSNATISALGEPVASATDV